MKVLAVYNNGKLAGHLSESVSMGYLFVYDDSYILDPAAPSISLTLPKSVKAHTSAVLFPFFANMVSEERNRSLQASRLGVGLDDLFSLLAETAVYDTAGAITVKKIADE